MTDAPERIWTEMDGEDILIHNNKPNLLELISTGLLLEYIRKDRHDALLKQAREDALREAAAMADGCFLVIAPESVSQRIGARSVQDQISAQILALISEDKTDG